MSQSTNRALCVLVGVLAVGVSFGQLTKEQKTQLSKADRMIAKAERDLKSIGKLFDNAASRGGLGHKEGERIQRDLTDVAEIIAEAREAMAGLPVGNSDVDAVQKRIDDSEALSKEYATRVETELGRVGGAEEALAKGHDTELEAVEALASEVRRFYMGVSGSQFPKERADGWATLKKQADAIAAKDAGMEGTSQKAQIFERAVRDLASKLEKADEAAAEAKKSIPAGVKDYLAKIQRLKTQALSQGSFIEFSVWIPAYRKAVDVWIYTYETVLDPAAGKALKAEAASQLAEIDRVEKEFFAKIVAENTVPKDNYSGDRSVIVQAAQAKAQRDNPANQVIKVIVTSSEWIRETGWKWDDTSAKWVKEDASHIYATVLVKSPDGKYAYMYDVGVERDHMRGGAVRTWGSSMKEKPKSPFAIVSIEKVK